MITSKNGAIYMSGNGMELVTEFAAIVTALNDKCDFPKEFIVDTVKITLETVHERKGEGKDIWE